MASLLTGFRRHDGRVGVRNHVLVLPSVVCSSHVAYSVAAAGSAISITHQHGCLHVGDDLRHTEGELLGAATSPNVGAVVVVSLGCETLNGKRLADQVAEFGQRVELVGIQHTGGTRRAVELGREAVTKLTAETGCEQRVPISPEELLIGIDNPDVPLAESIVGALRAHGISAVLPAEDQRGAEAHVELTRQGAQIIISLPSEDEAPIGFAVSPVISVARDAPLHQALADDFDVVQVDAESETELAERVAAQVIANAGGVQTKSELLGARDFVLHRLAVTM